MSASGSIRTLPVLALASRRPASSSRLASTSSAFSTYWSSSAPSRSVKIGKDVLDDLAQAPGAAAAGLVLLDDAAAAALELQVTSRLGFDDEPGGDEIAPLFFDVVEQDLADPFEARRDLIEEAG